MNLLELIDYIKEQHLLPNDDITTLIIRLIYDKKIPSFIPLLTAYLKVEEEQREYTKCELIETASLLHIRRAGSSTPNQSQRELHMINKHSNFLCKIENEQEGYDAEQCEKEFKKIYNIK